jgi:hypothetical protein
MSVRRAEDGVIALEGECPIEDAEKLLALLSENPGATVDWRGCRRAHAAVVQALMVAGATLWGPPEGAFLRQFVEPAMKSR